MNEQNRKPTLKERFRYWFDNQMAHGSLGLIKLLLIATVLVIVLVTAVIMLLGADDEAGTLGILWDTMTTTINAWMPYSGDGNLAYLILMGIAAIVGVLVTSVLIGIFSSAIEEKITDLKNGNSAVLEQDHIVVLGFASGEYTLIQQLAAASVDDGKRCIVVAGDMTREEMEDEIQGNVEIPKNVRLVCRNIDIQDPASLKKCCIEEAQSVIINPTEDIDTVKVLLAVTNVLGKENHKVSIYSVVSDSRYLLSESFAKTHKSVQLLANRTLSKLIAHSCTQPGLSRAFLEFLDCSGSNLYEVVLKEAEEMSFRELVQKMDGAVPVGVFTENRYVLNPEADMVVKKGDKVLIFADTSNTAVIADEAMDYPGSRDRIETAELPAEKILILGVNEEIETVLAELPEREIFIRIAGADEEQQEEIREFVKEHVQETGRAPMHVAFVRNTVPSHQESLEKIVEDADHVVVLSDHESDEDEADVDNIMRIMKLREIRDDKEEPFSITAELRRERNQKLADTGDGTDFIVALNMISLFLSQLADRPVFGPVFKELLSNEGNELFLKSREELGISEGMTCGQARVRAYDQGYILLGSLIYEDGCPRTAFNPDRDEILTLKENDRLIVLGEE